MEWVLQVVDEIDDGIGALRHAWLGVHAQIAAGLVAFFPVTSRIWEIDLTGRRGRG